MEFFVCISYCGFNNAILFENITEEDICSVEKFVREELLEVISTNAEATANADEFVMDEKQLIENFGQLYAMNPEKFRFQAGDRKFIQLVRDHIRCEIEKKGRKRALCHFAYGQPNKKKQKDNEGKEVENDINSTKSSLKTKLTEQILRKMKMFAVPQSILDVFNESFVNVNVCENRDITGTVICVVCHTQSEHPENIKPKNVFCREKSGSKSWVISNFVTHLKRVHSNFQLDKTAVIIPPTNQHLSNVTHENTESDEQTTDTRESINFSIESLSDFDGDEECRMEKILNHQISKHVINMWKIVTINGECLEIVRCNCDDGTILTVEVAKIPMDGDCLFSSIAHQLFGNDLNSSEHQKSTNKLRADVVQFIQQHFKEFEFELQGHVYQLKENKLIPKINQIGDIHEACKYLLNECLIHPGCWGGRESLKAIVSLYDVNIISFYENGPVDFLSAQQQTDRNVIIAYRLAGNDDEWRNHYDSVCNISSTDIYNTVKIFCKKLNHNLNQNASKNISLDTSS